MFYCFSRVTFYIYFSCWPNGIAAVTTILVPIIFVILLNMLIFTLIMRKHCCLSRDQKLLSSSMPSNQSRRQTIIMSTCFVNMGLTWSFAFFLYAFEDVRLRAAFAFLFCLFNSAQGLLIFLVYVVLSPSRRKQLSNLKRSNITSSTFLSSSSSNPYIISNSRKKLFHTGKN